jgi:hypothetical protein
VIEPGFRRQFVHEEASGGKTSGAKDDQRFCTYADVFYSPTSALVKAELKSSPDM